MAWYDFLKKDPNAKFGLDNLSTAAKVIGGSLGTYGIASALGKADSLNKFLGFGGGDSAPVGYQGGIPEYTASRTAVTPVLDPKAPRRPGSFGRRYFSDMAFTPTGQNLGGVKAPVAGERMSQEDLTDFITAFTSQPAAGAAPKSGTTTTPSGGTKTIPQLPLKKSTTPVAIGAAPSDMTSKDALAAYAKKAMSGAENEGRSIDSGEAATLLSSANALNVSPKDLAAMLGVSETQVINRLATDYPNMKDDYLTRHGYQYARGGLTSLGRSSARRAQSPVSFRAANSSQRPPQQRPQQWDPGNGAAGRLSPADGFSGPMVSPMQPGMSPTNGRPGMNPYMDVFPPPGMSPAGGMAQANSGTYDVGAPPASHAPMGGYQQTALPESMMPQGNVEMARRALGDFFPPPGAGPAGGMSPTGGMPGMSPAGGKQLDPSVMSWLSGMSGKSPTGGMNPAAGGMSFAEGGLASLKHGMYLGGATDGMADELPATINGEQEAALSDGEFVVPADVVSHLGNGNSDAGAQVLYAMMDRVRQARTGNVKQGKRINPGKMLPK